MRGNLVLFTVLLSAAGGTVAWKIAHDHGRFVSDVRVPDDPTVVGRISGLRLPRDVRVALTSGPVDTIEIAVDGPYSVRSVDSSQVLARGESLKSTAASVVADGFRISGRDYRATRLEVEADNSPAIWIGRHQYRGKLQLFHQPGGRMLVVNVVPLEEYVASVVDGEMPATFPEAARQAQAIVARTYVAFQTQAAKNHALYDVHASTRSQNYLGFQYRNGEGRRYAAESESSRNVVRKTAGMVCVFDGKLFCTYYTAVCGGRTAGGRAVFADSAPPLQSVPCEWCRDAELYRWRRELPLVEATELLKQSFAARGKPFGSVATVRRTHQTDDVNQPAFDVSDGKRKHRLTTAEFRRLLPSSSVHSFRFEPRVSDGKLVIEGSGHGHGVGLCQSGARGLALSGRGLLDILRYYYPGADVVQTE